VEHHGRKQEVASGSGSRKRLQEVTTENKSRRWEGAMGDRDLLLFKFLICF
jgi:hypothetical protein